MTPPIGLVSRNLSNLVKNHLVYNKKVLSEFLLGHISTRFASLWSPHPNPCRPLPLPPPDPAPPPQPTHTTAQPRQIFSRSQSQRTNNYFLRKIFILREVMTTIVGLLTTGGVYPRKLAGGKRWKIIVSIMILFSFGNPRMTVLNWRWGAEEKGVITGGWRGGGNWRGGTL